MSEDFPPDSPEFRKFRAGLDAWQIWEDLSAAERCEIILSSYAASQWFEEPALPTLAHFYTDKVAWGRIKAKGIEIGLNGRDFDHAIQAYLGLYLNGTAQTTSPLIVTFDTLSDEQTEWLWWPYLPLGALVMLDGDPGLGKSLLTTTLGAILSRGWPLPDQQGQLTLPTGTPSDTLLLSAEDSLTRTIKRRLHDANADQTRLHALTGWQDSAGVKQWFTLQHLPVLEEALLGLPSTRLVIIDPIQAYLGPIDMHRSNETRPLLAALSDIAERHRLCVCCVRHPSKPGQGVGKAMHRGLGSVDFIGAARSGLFVEAHPVDPVNKVLLAQSKNNLDRLGRTQVFSKVEGMFAWQGVTRLSVEQIAGSGRGPDPQVFLEAFCWLEERLKGGLAWESADIEEEMTEEGFKDQLIKRVKKALGVVSRKTADGSWKWRLPDLQIIDPPTTVSPSSPSSLSSLSSLSSPPLGNSIGYREREPGEEG